MFHLHDLYTIKAYKMIMTVSRWEFWRS